MTSSVSRKLAAILAMDMVGYSRLMGVDEDGTIARQKALQGELISPKIAEYNGRLVKTTGDGLLCEFPSAVDAVLCAVTIQRGIAEREADMPADRRIAYRAGINLGEIVIDGDDILGDGVNVAARLESLVEPGGIRISDVVFKNVRGKLDLGFADLGAQKVKNIIEPVSTYEVLLDPGSVGSVLGAKRKRRWSWPIAAVAIIAGLVVAVGVVLWRPWAPTEITTPTIAVLPLVNPSGSAEQNYLGRGIAGDLFTDISKISGLRVAAWEASSRINPGDADLKQIGAKLNVAYVLTGDIRKAGDVLRVNIRLVNVSSGFNLWAERYERDTSRIFELQNDITRKVVAALKLKLTPAEKTLVGKRTTADPEAYDLLLRARAQSTRIRPWANAAAIELLKKAIERDPKFAQAYAQLAVLHFWTWNFGGASDPTVLDRGAEIARKAIAIDPSVPDSHVALGFLNIFRRRHDEALASLRTALKLDPNNGDILSRVGFAHLMAGNPDEGLKYVEAARRRTTNEPWFYSFWAAQCHFYLGRSEVALKELKSSIARNPRAFPAYGFLAVVLVETGKMKEAKAAVGEVLSVNPFVSLGFLKRTMAFKNPAYAERQLRALRKLDFPE